VPAGDIGVGAREIGFLFGQYKRLRNEFTGVLTGKGINWGGSLMRPQATGYGCVYFAEEMLKSRGVSLQGRSVLISGSGNVALYAAEKSIQRGAKVLTLSDSDGTLHDKTGLTPEKLEWIKELKNVRRGRIKEAADKFAAEYLPSQQPWAIPADCALPCATQNELSAADAKLLIANNCTLVAEGANMPSTPDAVALFLQHKLLYGPGKAANAGGVSTSGLEMSQNSLHLSWTAAEVDAKLHGIMTSIHATCLKTAEEYGEPGNYLCGANIAGFIKVADAMIDQGVV